MILCALFMNLFALGVFLLHFANAEDADKWEVEFSYSTQSINLGEPEDINLSIYNLNMQRLTESNATIQVISRDPGIMKISKIISLDEINDGRWNGSFTAIPNTLGIANVFVEIVFLHAESCSIIEVSPKSMEIKVLRNHNIIDINRWFSPQFYFYLMHIFFVLGNVAFGAALDLDKLRAIFQYPIVLFVIFLFDFFLFPFVSNSRSLLSEKFFIIKKHLHQS